jgi:NADPH:quinone reductase-like Zn-dependent oxidoreductase
MKAVLLTNHGGLENLRYSSIPTPRPKRGEALIRVKACALNHLDIWVRMGFPGADIPLPHILGCEVAGTVEEFGSAAESYGSGFKKGDSVLVAPGIRQGNYEEYLTQNDSLAPGYQILGFQRKGGYAEYVAVPVENLIPIAIGKSSGQSFTYETWAAFPLVFLTAWRMLVTRGGLQAGQSVLIHAAGSGIGQAAIQVAKFLGARVIATVGAESKCRKARSLGADEVINYTKQDFTKAARELTDGKGVDLVFEHVGASTFSGSIASCRKGGRVVTCGVTTGREVTLDIRYLFMNQISIHGSYMGSHAELLKVVELAKQGHFASCVDSVFPLREAAKAQAKMESRNFFGKIVLKP